MIILWSQHLVIFFLNEYIYICVCVCISIHILFYLCRYLSALISQSFLDIGSVSRILDGIMKLCLQFCWMIESQDNKESTAELEHIAEVWLTGGILLASQLCNMHKTKWNMLSFKQEFNKKSNSLYTILRSSRIAGSQRAPFLRRFLLRLNFNSFFEVNFYAAIW